MQGLLNRFVESDHQFSEFFKTCEKNYSSSIQLYIVKQVRKVKTCENHLAHAAHDWTIMYLDDLHAHGLNISFSVKTSWTGPSLQLKCGENRHLKL